MRRRWVALLSAISAGLGIATCSAFLAVPSAMAGPAGHSAASASVAAPATLRAGLDRDSVGRQGRPDNDGASLVVGVGALGVGAGGILLLRRRRRSLRPA